MIRDQLIIYNKEQIKVIGLLEKILLPSSFTGSPRNVLQHYQDAIAIVRIFGRHDLSIKMTCNPNWRGIKENLLPGVWD